MGQEIAVVLLLSASLAAMATAFGVVPMTGGGSRGRIVGLAEALAAGFMLGASHLLLTAGLRQNDVLCIVGASAGVGYTLFVQWYAGTSKESEGTGGPLDGEAVHQGTVVRELLQSALHSASEGIAIGIGFVLEPRLGVVLALIFGLHNVGEGMAIADVLLRAGTPRRQVAALCVVAKLSQPLFALATFALSPILGRLPAMAAGFSAGSLAFLVLTEQLPDAYKKASRTSIAAMATAAAALVVLLEDYLV